MIDLDKLPLEPSFKLDEEFINKYKDKQPEWGPLGYITYKRTYSRNVDGQQEEFWQTVQRVVETVYTIQKEYIVTSKRRWNEIKAQKSAQKMYEYIFDLKFTPPGRGFWALYLPLLKKKGGGALNNCGYVSTKDIDIEFSEPFCFLMDFSMLGVGIGFDTIGAGKVKIQEPEKSEESYIVEDSREGWVGLLRLILNSFIGHSKLPGDYRFRTYKIKTETSYKEIQQYGLNIDYSKIREEGAKIETFGGTASGPEPLMSMINNIYQILTNRINDLITSTDIVDIMNLIGKCVVSGNVRRSSEIALGDFEDKEFLKLKDPTESNRLQRLLKKIGAKDPQWKQLQSEREELETVLYSGKLNALSEEATIMAQRLELIKKEQEEIINTNEEYKEVYSQWKNLPLVSWRWNSNNTFKAKLGMKYDRVANQLITNGEPAPLWLEMIQKYGRLIDPPTYKDYRVLGTNPSLRAGTKVLTSKGIFPIEKLEGQKVKVLNSNNHLKDAECFLSGKNKPLYRVKLETGIEYYSTAEHKWPIIGQDKILTKDLIVGQKLPVVRKDKLFDSDFGSYDDGLLIGWLYGDGWVTIRSDNSKTQYGLIFSKEDEKHNIKDRILQIVSSITGNNYTGTVNDGNTEINIISKSFDDYMKKFGVKHKKYGLPESIWTSSEEFRKGFIDGLFSSDGSVEYKNSRVQICLNQSNKNLIMDVSELLGFYGLIPRVYYSKIKGTFPNGKDYNKLYDLYSLKISATRNVLHFRKLFSLSHREKNNKLNSPINLENIKKAEHVKIKEIELTNIKEDVWDLSVFDETHNFNLSHCVTGNCCEQSLEDKELCLLVENYPTKCQNLTEFKEVLKMSYFYAKTISLIPTHYSPTNEIIARNRRIGSSMAGIIEMYCNLGIYECKKWWDSGYKYICELDKKYSEWLGIPESIKKTSIKPGGSVPLLVGVEGGMKTSLSEYFFRTIRIDKNSPLVELHKNAGYRVEEDISSLRTMIIYFPVHDTRSKRFAKDFSIWEQMEILSALQTYWADNQVSCTITFKLEESKDISRVLELFEGRIKNVSFLPLDEHGYPQAPYIPCSKEEYEIALANIKEIDWSSIQDVKDQQENFCDGQLCLLKK